jgi:AcrR family transcriptional regulator
MPHGHPLRSPLAARPTAVSGRGAVRRQAMLDAACEVFLEHGFEGASVADVVRRSGGSLATLYSSFGSKEGLFEAIVAQISAAMVAPFEAADFESRPLEEGLREFGERLLGTMLCPDAVRWQRMCVAEGPQFPALRTALVRSGPGQVRERLAAYLAAHARAGRLRLADPLVAARHFVALLKSETHLAALCGEPVEVSATEIATQVRRAVQVFLHGYSSEPRPAARTRRPRRQP